MKINRTETIDAAHLLDLKDSPCSRIHGHSYKIEIEIETDLEGDKDMVLDFNEIKKVVKELDHKMLVDSISGVEDHKTLESLKSYIPEKFYWFVNAEKMYIVPQEDVILLNFQPTVENLCSYFIDRFKDILKRIYSKFRIRVKIWETENSSAEDELVVQGGKNVWNFRSLE
jgi:6-pyruvoyltetrahydropterin/6-carboxytetrahydropterin synthase